MDRETFANARGERTKGVFAEVLSMQEFDTVMQLSIDDTAYGSSERLQIVSVLKNVVETTASDRARIERVHDELRMHRDGKTAVALGLVAGVALVYASMPVIASLIAVGGSGVALYDYLKSKLGEESVRGKFIAELQERENVARGLIEYAERRRTT